MAERPVFIAKSNQVGVEIIKPSFVWHSGYAVSQKQKSIQSLHEAAQKSGATNILEISSKSESELGVMLSAFNLSATTKNTSKVFTVESAFQSSKVFEFGGPYTDLLFADSRIAKKDERIRSSGKLVGFEFSGKRFPNWPLTYFYDWLYTQFLLNNVKYMNAIMDYRAFTDIEFNPEKSINCQAHSVALFVSLKLNKVTDLELSDPIEFLNATKVFYGKTSIVDIKPNNDSIKSKNSVESLSR